MEARWTGRSEFSKTRLSWQQPGAPVVMNMKRMKASQTAMMEEEGQPFLFT